MATFPETLPDPSVGSRGSVNKAQVRTPFEGGYVQSRPKYTRSRKKYELVWHLMTDDDFDTLEQFFLENQGGSFTFPFLGEGDFRFSNDEIEYEWEESGMHRTVNVFVEEI
jgi:hypothetical protein